jgi:drug/metabolite transporter (DMT)-like permease
MHSKPVHHGKGIALAFISMALGALITIWYKPMMEQGMPAISIALIESCVMVLILLIAKPWRVLRSNKRIQYPILICSVCQAVGGISYFFGLSYLDPVTFSFLTRNQAIFSVLFGFFFLSERHNIVTWLFIVLAVIGSLTLCYADINSMNLAGIVYAVLFCLSFGVRNFILRKHPRTPALVNIFYGYLLTIVFLLLMACFSSAYKFHE